MFSAATIFASQAASCPERVPQGVAVGDQVRQHALEFVEGNHFIEAKASARGLRTMPETVPDFAFLVLLAAEKDRTRLFPTYQHDHGFGFRESR